MPNSVSTIVGQMQFTRIFSCAWSSAIARVSPETPALAAQYAARSLRATKPSAEPILTIEPPPALRNGASAAAKVGDPLYEKDTIETGADGSIGITFIDNTVMSGGPNSQIVLEDYKFNSSDFKGSMLTDMNRGTVSMISGDIARSTPGAMKVKTPTAILAVRGTSFVIEVKP